jgi:hypothetical protein
MTFTFNSRDTYLAYKADWKQRYLEQSKKQRELKFAIREANRKKGYAMSEEYAYKDGVRDVQELISERHASKEESARQWEAKHQPV